MAGNCGYLQYHLGDLEVGDVGTDHKGEALAKEVVELGIPPGNGRLWYEWDGQLVVVSAGGLKHFLREMDFVFGTIRQKQSLLTSNF